MGLTVPWSCRSGEPTGSPLGDAWVQLIPCHPLRPSVGHYQHNPEHGRCELCPIFSLRSAPQRGEGLIPCYSLITLSHPWVQYHEVPAQVLLASPNTLSLAKFYLRVSRVESKEGLISSVSWFGGQLFISILLSPLPLVFILWWTEKCLQTPLLCFNSSLKGKGWFLLTNLHAEFWIKFFAASFGVIFFWAKLEQLCSRKHLKSLE